MQNSTYTIYNASAGSGKTFTIAKSYIKLLVLAKNYNHFKSVLAITFTNKAVGEMKMRVINMLKLFSDKTSLTAPHPMFSTICCELSISAEYLHNKSKHILKHIIHNYGAFDISTIDGFTHRIIRTFAHDLKLPVNFEVELDQDRLINEAVDSLISRAGKDDALTTILVDFAIEKADDDKSWDISYDFNKIAKLLVNENDIKSLDALKDKSLTDFKQLKEILSNSIITLEEEIVKTATSILTLLEECGLKYDDFSGKYIPKYFIKLSEKTINVSYGNIWQDNLLEGGALYPKRVTSNIAETIDSIQPNIAKAFTKTKTLIYKLKQQKGFLKHITPLSLLNAIQKELNSLKEEQNKMLISEFNKIISNEIKDQPTPFIYERLGEKFKHYFIDEFQDTSQMQWDNLVPLLDNALSASNGSAMLVGDAKQAIYRWRGGEAEQFINLYNKTKNPFQIKAEVLSLGTNYRSAKEIINFNNAFFNFLSASYFSNQDYTELYKNAEQDFNSNLNGFVNLKFLEISKEDNSTELYTKAVYDTINTCVKRGCKLEDICVIVRKGKQGVAVAEYLSERGINITSSETLLLKNSNRVKFLNAFLKLLLQPENDSLKIEVLSLLAKQHHVEDYHLFFETHLHNTLEKVFKSLETLNIIVNKNQLLRLPLYELIEQLIRIFKLNETSDAYIQFYLDVVLEFTQKQKSDLSSFLTYFEKKKENLSIVSPQNANAVQIITIHKSKGLEFPIVIFPFADLNISKELEPKVWFPVDKSKFANFESLLINYNKDIEHFGETGTQIYNEHESQLQLDNINLLYVTLTRAVDQLYVISKKDISAKGDVNENTYSGMFIKYLQSINVWSDQRFSYEFGTFNTSKEAKEKEETSEIIQLISVPKEVHNLNIITKSGQLWDTKQEKAIERGNLVHLLLSKIKTVVDLDFAFNELLLSGDITTTDEEELRHLVLEVIQHPVLKPYYTNNYEIYNERDIITSSGQLLRPDRLNINANNEVIIIDYKTGEHKPSYKSQLNQYASVVESMDLTTKHKYIVYINEDVGVIEV